MRILLVYPNITRQHTPQVGLASIAAVTREAGHQLQMFDVTVVAEGQEEAAFFRCGA